MGEPRATDKQPDERPRARPEIRHLELAVKGAQGDLRRKRVMRSDPEGVIEITLRGDFFPSRIRLKDRAALDEAAVTRLEEAVASALRAAVEGVYEEQRDRLRALLPLGGSGLAYDGAGDGAPLAGAVIEEIDPGQDRPVSVKTGEDTEAGEMSGMTATGRTRKTNKKAAGRATRKGVDP